MFAQQARKMEKKYKGLYWSRFARTYDVDVEYVVGKPILQALKERLSNEHRLGELVEFGCGPGFLTKEITWNTKQVIATYLSDEMVKVARELLIGLENMMVKKADCGNTTYSGKSY